MHAPLVCACKPILLIICTHPRDGERDTLPPYRGGQVCPVPFPDPNFLSRPVRRPVLKAPFSGVCDTNGTNGTYLTGRVPLWGSKARERDT